MSNEVKYEICRVCGYIRHIGKGGRCEACNARETAFVPYQYRVSSQRLLFLEFDIHPVTVHFTTSFTITTAVLFVLSFLTSDLLGIPIGYGGILDLLVLILPLFVIAGGLSGLIDGKTRYRKLKTPFLIRKIILGNSLLVISIIMLISHILSNEGVETFMVTIEAICMLAAVIIASYIGWIGSKLGCAIVPRGTEIK
ncbi:MAG: hypothetical protein ACFFAJ_07205 [Candidatus Hodarchaeota archaeon]